MPVICAGEGGSRPKYGVPEDPRRHVWKLHRMVPMRQNVATACRFDKRCQAQSALPARKRTVGKIGKKVWTGDGEISIRMSFFVATVQCGLRSWILQKYMLGQTIKKENHRAKYKQRSGLWTYRRTSHKFGDAIHVPRCSRFGLAGPAEL